MRTGARTLRSCSPPAPAASASTSPPPTLVIIFDSDWNPQVVTSCAALLVCECVSWCVPYAVRLWACVRLLLLSVCLCPPMRRMAAVLRESSSAGAERPASDEPPRTASGSAFHVNIYRFVTMGSVEQDILERRPSARWSSDHVIIQRMDTSGARRTSLRFCTIATTRCAVCCTSCLCAWLASAHDC